MIRDVSQRNHYGNLCEPIETMRPLCGGNGALRSFIQFELGFGGRVTALSPTSVTVVTDLGGCVDTTTFSGTPEEMHPLVEVAAVHCALMSDHCDDVARSVVDNAMAMTDGNPLLLSFVAPMIMDTGSTRVATIVALRIQNEDDARAAAAMRLEDLISLYELIVENTGRSFRELYEATR